MLLDEGQRDAGPARLLRQQPQSAACFCKAPRLLPLSPSKPSGSSRAPSKPHLFPTHDRAPRPRRRPTAAAVAGAVRGAAGLGDGVRGPAPLAAPARSPRPHPAFPPRRSRFLVRVETTREAVPPVSSAAATGRHTGPRRRASRSLLRPAQSLPPPVPCAGPPRVTPCRPLTPHESGRTGRRPPARH